MWLKLERGALAWRVAVLCASPGSRRGVAEAARGDTHRRVRLKACLPLSTVRVHITLLLRGVIATGRGLVLDACAALATIRRADPAASFLITGAGRGDALVGCREAAHLTGAAVIVLLTLLIRGVIHAIAQLWPGARVHAPEHRVAIVRAAPTTGRVTEAARWHAGIISCRRADLVVRAV